MDELTLRYNAEKKELTIFPISSSRLRDITEVVRCAECVSKIHDNASDEDWCNNPGGLCCRLHDNYFCPFGERRTNV